MKCTIIRMTVFSMLIMAFVVVSMCSSAMATLTPSASTICLSKAGGYGPGDGTGNGGSGPKDGSGNGAKKGKCSMQDKESEPSVLAGKGKGKMYGPGDGTGNGGNGPKNGRGYGPGSC